MPFECDIFLSVFVSIKGHVIYMFPFSLINKLHYGANRLNKKHESIKCTFYLKASEASETLLRSYKDLRSQLVNEIGAYAPLHRPKKEKQVKNNI